ncbi:efflux RND transporter permease subunit [Nioella sp.]|uniref:efflux RND transporter permease subunit n=1 Tax=Nioella sp. TaxID=1912091 RepID=UPI003B51806E
MMGMVDWAASRARMVVAFVVLSVVVGTAAYIGLPKEGEPDIDIPGLFVSVPFPGISAEDSERLLVRPMEAEFQNLDGLQTISATAAEGYAGIFLEFEFGWDKDATIAEVREAMDAAEAQFPDGAESYSINEINFSEFPIIIVALSGEAPERTLLRLAQELQDRLEALPPILEAGLAGGRDEMVEVVIDPLALEAYNVTARELIDAVVNNNQLIAAGEVSTASGAISVSIPSSFETTEDIYNLPIKVNGDRVVTLGDLAEIRLTYEDREGTARFNGENAIALQVVKRLGFNIMDTAALVRAEIEAAQAEWPEELRQSVSVTATLDQSVTVQGMVSQLEGSVLTAIALVMIVVLAALGTRSALLVGFAIPTSFLLCFIFLGIMGVTISNIVMFGLILAVGMLVDGAIVVVEYADKRLAEGARPMQAYTDAAKRMFWPIVSSTATTLCAFLPMLFWPGVPGEFMGMLPVTLIFVLSASLIVALIYLPVLGGVAARYSRLIDNGTAVVKALIPWWPVRALLTAGAGYLMFLAALETISPGGLIPVAPEASAFRQMLPGMVMFVAAASLMSVMIGSVAIHRKQKRIRAGYRRSPFGWFIHAIVGNPVMPLVTIGAVIFFVVSVFVYFQANNNGVEFFVESEPENGIVYVRARGNLSVDEMDMLVRQVEARVLATEGVRDVFAFSGQGGLNNNTGGAEQPRDTIGQVQFDLLPWDERPVLDAPVSLLGGLIQFPRTVIDPAYDGDTILAGMQDDLDMIPGIRTEIFSQSRGPSSGKPVNLRLAGDNWEELQEATRLVRDRFEATPALTLVEDTLPLPGVDWELTVDVEAAGRYGANVATVGAMVQLVTRGILLDTMRVPTSDEEIEIRVRFPEEARVLSTLDTLRVRTADGLVPLANFVTRTPAPQLAEIDRRDQSRIFNVRADVLDGLVMLTDTETGESWLEDATAAEGSFAVQEGLRTGALTLTPVNANERIAAITEWLETENPLPASVSWEWGGDQEEEQESQAFLGQAFGAALGLMFIILLAQFNSVYNSVLVLLAVVLSTVGVLIGMLVMDQTFSIIMTGTGIVALAGIVVNNNIVLIDTYQEYSRYMPQLEAITRTAEARIRPVLLTTITTMAGLMPMMYGISLDFAAGGYSVDSPTALWWKQLATAVVFGLGVATVLTLVLTPSLLALRVWFWTILSWVARAIGRLGARGVSQRAQDWALARAARRTRHPEILWEEPPQPVFIIEAPEEAPAPENPPQEEEDASTDAPLRAAE